MNNLSVVRQFLALVMLIFLSIPADSLLASTQGKVIQTETLTLLGNRKAADNRQTSFLPFKSSEKIINTKSLTFTGKGKQKP